MRQVWLHSLLSILVFAGVAHAQPILVVPNAFANAEANAGTSVPTTLSTQSGGRTYQMQIAASQLSAIPVGGSISGLRWRLDDSESGSFPPTTATWTNYDFILAQAANPIGSMSTTFANNMVNPVTVRGESLSFTAAAFPGGGSPNAFGPLINFTTPYVYQGGDLVLYFTHSGSNITTSAFIDAADNTTEGYGTLFRAQFGLGYENPTASGAGTDFHALVTQFQYSAAVPEPATWALL